MSSRLPSSRRHVLKMLLIWPSVSLFAHGFANPLDDWPQRPIELIVPWPAGGPTDLVCRVLAQEASSVLGQSVLVRNLPGASGTLVAPALVAAAPDGYTIGQVPVTVFRHALRHAVSWDPWKDLAPILQIAEITFGWIVPAGSPWQDLKALLSWAHDHPKRLTVATTGPGSTGHLAACALLTQASVTATLLPYKGISDLVLAVASGQVMAGVAGTGFAPWVAEGKVRLLVTFSRARHPRWPEVPTATALGFAHAIHTSPWGFMAPAAVPAARLERLQQAFALALQRPAAQEIMARFEQELAYLGTAQYRAALVALRDAEEKLLSLPRCG